MPDAVPNAPRPLCTKCGQPFRSPRAVRPGEDVTCPRCVRPPAAPPGPVRDTLPARPRHETAGPEPVENLPVIPGYRLSGVLGRGGMGVVYRGWDERLQRAVAVKLLTGGFDPARFRTEATAAARLQHPGIVQVYASGGEAQGRPYLVLEYVDGGTLQQRAGGKPQPPRAAAGVVEQVARAVGFMHQHRVLHRDLKPANILLARGGQGEAAADADVGEAVARYGLPKVADFGLARELDRDFGLTRGDQALGTLAYMAPEQARGRREQVREAADVYALGAILYELLAGRPPFVAAEPGELYEQVTREPPVPPRRLAADVPRDLEAVCLRCLEKDPVRRYPSAAELADDLRRFLRREPVAAGSGVSAAGKTIRRGWSTAAVVGVAAVAALAGAAGGYLPRDHQARADAHAAEERQALHEARGHARRTTQLLAQYTDSIIRPVLAPPPKAAGQPLIDAGLLPSPWRHPAHGWCYPVDADRDRGRNVPVPFNFASKWNGEFAPEQMDRIMVYVYSDAAFEGRTHADPGQWRRRALDRLVGDGRPVEDEARAPEHSEVVDAVGSFRGRFLRYARAIVMKRDCCTCHNTAGVVRPDRLGRDGAALPAGPWDPGDVRGLIDVTIRLDY